MTAIVSISRLLDALVTGAFVVCLSGLSLYVLSLFYKFVVVTERARTGVFGNFLQNSLPFKHNRFEYNLTHIILFGILITLFTLCHHKYLDELEKKESKGGKSKASQKQ
ncbi:apicomplexan small protein, putative [Perkinsus marinus ATCC 50983]|nr:apicomplexan small protein, putative [Perkinsus marinus ATCC 50983]EER13765.1 apicomplexan small protein, putative [Perkinsus marinus ATCC 50983]|mmetsp:Transcript_2973/g.2903  ORF Transcript_2973/g.2903 Transcript_2973/m.2903 type:complete len:109 (-) Transcript_2973:38-364(-)|eukprot:XP_002781970.1 apicomplexan small protein, putative [Perkinsus marinus ATCC 50983]